MKETTGRQKGEGRSRFDTSCPMTVVIRTFIACRRTYLFFASVTLCLYPRCGGGVLFLAVQFVVLCHVCLISTFTFHVLARVRH
jgi:hypothetical protein